jgi:hypothetical protein
LTSSVFYIIFIGFANLFNRQSIDKNGYKSFKGGWIEGLSEEGHVYYYNTITGNSSWQLPYGMEGVEEGSFEETEPPQDETIFHQPIVHEPSNTFANIYDNGESGEYYAEPDGSYAYDYGGNQNYAENEQYNYDPNYAQNYDPNYYNDPNYSDPYYQQEYNPDAWDGVQHGKSLTISFTFFIFYYLEPVEQIKRPRNLPILVRHEVHNYSKKEGIDLQSSLLNSQDMY